MALLPMNDIINMLPPHSFMRIHKSYIISLKQIGVIERASVMIHGNAIPIGITYREHFSNIVRKKL